MLCGQIDPTTGVTVLCDACREIARIEAMYDDEDRCAHCGVTQHTGECAAQQHQCSKGS